MTAALSPEQRLSIAGAVEHTVRPDGARRPSDHPPQTPPPVIISAPELIAKNLPPVRWAVRELLPEGYAVLAGPPKLGKSWLVYQVGVAVAEGACFFGQDTEQADVLLIVLEDGERRARSRLEKVLDGRPAPTRLSFNTSWPRLDEGGMDAVERWAEGKRGAMVVLDTVGRVAPRSRRGANAYEADYSVHGPLHALAHRAGIALVGVTHTRQGHSSDFVEAVTGSSGITGAADTVLVLKRQRGQADGFLEITGRDVLEQELALKIEGGLWRCLGDARHVVVGETRAAVMRALSTAGERGLKPAEVAEKADRKRETVKKAMLRMAEDGFLLRLEEGRYALPKA